jgi:hypothetical protein
VPFYRFEFRDGTRTQTMPDIDLPDLDAAYEEAKRSTRDLLMEATLKGEERTGWACRVYDRDGQRILSVNFEDIVLNRADDNAGTGLP